MVNGLFSRRRVLQGLLAIPFIGMASAATPQRVAVLDWGLAELVLALGIVPVAVSAPQWYRKLINCPPLPATVADIGLLFQPNIEALYALRPDAILVTPQHALLKPALERVAPTISVPTDGLAGYTAAATQLGELFGRQRQAAEIIDRLQRQIAQTHDIAAQSPQPVLLAFAVDTLHLRVLGQGCLLGDVLAACQIENGWRTPFPPSGQTLVELTQIADLDARLLLLAADDDERSAITLWRRSALWQRFPLTSGANLQLAATNFSSAGALVTARRFAALLGNQLAGWHHA